MHIEIEFSDSFIDQAKASAKQSNRSLVDQIKYWVNLGKLIDQNPDLPLGFVQQLLVEIAEFEPETFRNYKFS